MSRFIALQTRFIDVTMKTLHALKLPWERELTIKFANQVCNQDPRRAAYHFATKFFCQQLMEKSKKVNAKGDVI